MSKKKNKKNSVKNWCLNHGGFLLGVFSFVVLILTSLCLVFIENNLPIELVKFSKDSGFFDDDIEVVLEGDDTIMYTLGSEDVIDKGEVYTEPIKFGVPEKGYKLYTITAVSCRAEKECGRKETKTYVLGKNVYEMADLDIVNIMAKEEDLYDYEKGILVPGKRYDENQSEHSSGYIAGNYNERGEEWMKNAHIVMLDTAGNEKINKDVGIIVSGGTSSAMDVKSLKIMSNKEYGYSKIPFDFGDGPRLYNSLRFRAGAQDQFSGNIRSAVISRLANESGFDGCTKTKRVTLFLNNEFYGIFDAQQNYSTSFIADNFGLADPGLVAKFKGNEVDSMKHAGVYDLFNKDLNMVENREALEEKVDMDNYLLYYALEIMWNNTDWPSNSFEMWRYNKGENESDNKYEDGRLRFLVYDTDLTWYIDGNARYYPGAVGDIFKFLMENVYRGDGSSFRNVMASDYYKGRFVQILRELIGGVFETGHVLKTVDEEAAKIDRQIHNFYSDEDYENWQGWINLLKKAVSERNAVVRADALEYLGVSL